MILKRCIFSISLLAAIAVVLIVVYLLLLLWFIFLLCFCVCNNIIDFCCFFSSQYFVLHDCTEVVHTNNINCSVIAFKKKKLFVFFFFF